MPSGAAPVPVDFTALKTRQQAAWASGDYAVIGTTLQIVGEQLAEACDLRWDERVLDVAAGNGNATLAAARRGCDVISTDYVEALLERGAARARAERLRVGFQTADAESLPFENASFDAVFDLADLHNFEDWPVGVRQLHRVLAPGGLLILEELSRESFEHAAGRVFRALTEHPYECMLTISELRDELGRTGFEILHLRERRPLGLLRYFTLVARKV